MTPSDGLPARPTPEEEARWARDFVARVVAAARDAKAAEHGPDRQRQAREMARGDVVEPLARRDHQHLDRLQRGRGTRFGRQQREGGIDPLQALDPIYQSIQDARARDRLVAAYDHDVSEHEWATGYRWDIVLTGSNRTLTETDTEDGDH